MLQALKEQSFEYILNMKSYELAESFYNILYPLTHWLPNSPNNIKHEHIKRLMKVTRASLELAANLNARIGKFTFYSLNSGELFEPTIAILDKDSQREITVEDFPDTNKNMRKQTIALEMMCGVRRMMPGKDTESQYAKSRVVLRTPFVGNSTVEVMDYGA